MVVTLHHLCFKLHHLYPVQQKKWMPIHMQYTYSQDVNRVGLPWVATVEHIAKGGMLGRPQSGGLLLNFLIFRHFISTPLV